MAGAGNIYRHDYEDVAASRVWDTVQLALPPLKAAIEQELAPQGAMVVIEARHLCVEMRGVKKPGAVTVTSALRGIFHQREMVFPRQLS